MLIWIHGPITVDDRNSCITLKTLNYGNSGIILIMSNAGSISSPRGLGGSLNPKPLNSGSRPKLGF